MAFSFILIYHKSRFSLLFWNTLMNVKSLQMSVSSYYSLNFSVVWHVQRGRMINDFIKQNKLKQIAAITLTKFSADSHLASTRGFLESEKVTHSNCWNKHVDSQWKVGRHRWSLNRELDSGLGQIAQEFLCDLGYVKKWVKPWALWGQMSRYFLVILAWA